MLVDHCAGRRNAFLATALATVFCMGCSLSNALGRTSRSGPDEATVMLEVNNDQQSDVRVYILRGSARIPLGAVGGFERRTFRIKGGLLPRQASVRFLADPLASEDDFVSAAVDVMPGQVVEWRIAYMPALSSLIVR